MTLAFGQKMLKYYFLRGLLEVNADSRGHDFQLLPFGSGRRRCPGMHLGFLIRIRLVGLNWWIILIGWHVNDLDIGEKFGFTLQRVKDLLATPTYRLVRNST